MKYKRRIVYLSDDIWSDLSAIAADRHATISSTIRDLLFEPMRGEKMARYVVHHKDGTPNNDLDNLELREIGS